MNAPGAGAPDGGVGRDPPDQARLGQLAEEQAALRRVATLVARGEPPEAVFAAVAEEVGRLLSVDLVTMGRRYEPGHTVTTVATWGPGFWPSAWILADMAFRRRTCWRSTNLNSRPR